MTRIFLFLVSLILATPSVFAAAPKADALMGVYLGPGCRGTARLDEFQAWLGRRPSRGIDFFSDKSWDEFQAAAERSSKCWAATGLNMTFSLPMLPRDGTSNLEDGAKGKYNDQFVKVAQTLINNGFSNAVIRIGWEFNQSWYPWRADRNPQAWVAYWREIVSAMRSVPGARFRFDWCTAWGKGQIEPTEVYPGDEYVDIIGMDIYNISWTPKGPEERWEFKLNSPYGLQWQRDFAQKRGKPVSFAEWATGMRPDGRGGGDDPYYIKKMAAWIAGSNVAYHNYWNYAAKDFNGVLSNGKNPDSEKEFLKLFGGN